MIDPLDIDVGLRVEGKGMVCCGVDPDSVHVTVMGCNYAEECLSAKGFLRGETVRLSTEMKFKVC